MDFSFALDIIHLLGVIPLAIFGMLNANGFILLHWIWFSIVLSKFIVLYHMIEKVKVWSWRYHFARITYLRVKEKSVKVKIVPAFEFWTFLSIISHCEVIIIFFKWFVLLEKWEEPNQWWRKLAVMAFWVKICLCLYHKLIHLRCIP